MQNHWILINPRRKVNATDSSTIALETFEKYLGEAYILPESNVLLFVETADDAWEIWEGFRVSKTDKIRVNKHGFVTSSALQLNNSIPIKADLRGITLKATTVVRVFLC